jgi:hypothetical protein
VPVVEVRQRLGALLEAGSGDLQVSLAGALVEVCDGAGASVLTEALRTAPHTEAAGLAQLLAHVAPSDVAVVRRVFDESDSDETRLWLAIHLARGGDLDAMALVLDDADAGRFDNVSSVDLEAGLAAIAHCGLPPEVLDTVRHRNSSILVEILTKDREDAAQTEPRLPDDDDRRSAIQDACRRHWIDPDGDQAQAIRTPFGEVLAASIPLLSENPSGTIGFLASVVEHIDPARSAIADISGAPTRPAVRTEPISLPRPAMSEPADEVFEIDDGLESLSPPAPSVPEAADVDVPAASEDEEVYALLDCPTLPTAGDEFELTAGLSPRPSEGVQGGPLEGLGGRDRPYILTMHVVADGFDIREGESWRHDLAVTDAQPYPQVTLHLTPEDQSEPVRPAIVTATFTVDGQMVGSATRAVAVVLAGAEPPAVDGEVRGVDFSIPTSPVAPDLTVVLHKTRELHLLRMTIESPHRSVPIPDGDVEVDIGGRPDDYAQNLVRAMDVLEGRPELRRELKGRGRTLADSLPAEFWEALRAAAAASDGPPTLLLVSAEGRVPWELSIVDPPLDPALPPFLSTQTVMGRWVLGDTPLPPPHEHAFGSMAVVTGDYEGLSRWETLQAAFQERDTLQGEYHAEAVDATFSSVMELLERDPTPSILHLAVHGKYNPSTPQEGLILTDGTWLTPDGVRAEKIAGSPFVFLNACQVGSGSDELHQYTGLAAAFLASGASGVIAPLWSVKDEIARDIAVGFYTATVEQGIGVGEAIRREREAFAREDGEEPTSATFMAYQYFGHPALMLARAEDGRQ